MEATIINNVSSNNAGTMSLMAEIAKHLNVNINDFCGGNSFHGEHTSSRTPEGHAGAVALDLNPDFSTTCVFHRNWLGKRVGFVEYTYFITFDGNKRASIVRRDH